MSTAKTAQGLQGPGQARKRTAVFQESARESTEEALLRVLTLLLVQGDMDRRAGAYGVGFFSPTASSFKQAFFCNASSGFRTLAIEARALVRYSSSSFALGSI